MPSPRRALVVCGVLLLAACEPVKRRADGKGTFQLTAESPTAQVSAVFCMDGDELSSIRWRGHVQVHARTVDDGPQATVKVVTTEEHGVLDVAPGTTSTTGLKVDATGPWQHQAGPRCGEPRTIRFDLVEPVKSAKVDVEWRLEFIVEELGGALGSKLLHSSTSMKVDESGVPRPPVFEEW
jgi:hypothetical protein